MKSMREKSGFDVIIKVVEAFEQVAAPLRSGAEALAGQLLCDPHRRRHCLSPASRVASAAPLHSHRLRHCLSQASQVASVRCQTNFSLEMREKVGLDVLIKISEAFEELLPEVGGFMLVIVLTL